MALEDLPLTTSSGARTRLPQRPDLLSLHKPRLGAIRLAVSVRNAARANAVQRTETRTPSPLMGEGRGKGENHRCQPPSPYPSPARGEGTLKQSRDKYGAEVESLSAAGG